MALERRRKGPRVSWSLVYCNRTATRSAQGLVHRSCGRVSHAGQNVRIGVQGYRDGGVAQELLHKLGVYALTE